jgi:hypothetical protein
MKNHRRFNSKPGGESVPGLARNGSKPFKAQCERSFFISNHS